MNKTVAALALALAGLAGGAILSKICLNPELLPLIGIFAGLQLFRP